MSASAEQLAEKWQVNRGKVRSRGTVGKKAARNCEDV